MYLTNCISAQLSHHGFTIQFIYFCKVNGKSTGDTEPAKAKAKAKPTKPAVKEVAEKENELSVSLLNIQVGLIRKAWKHPSADRYVMLANLPKNLIIKHNVKFSAIELMLQYIDMFDIC